VVFFFQVEKARRADAVASLATLGFGGGGVVDSLVEAGRSGRGSGGIRQAGQVGHQSKGGRPSRRKRVGRSGIVVDGGLDGGFELSKRGYGTRRLTLFEFGETKDELKVQANLIYPYLLYT
jgi:hypothetical protein